MRTASDLGPGNRREIKPRILGLVSGLATLLIFSCYACKKNPVDTYTVVVSPGKITVLTGMSQTFTATIQDNGQTVNANPTWSVSPADAGTLNLTSGPSVVFTTVTGSVQSVTLSATYEGVTGSALIST
jgi:hypothetical protein